MAPVIYNAWRSRQIGATEERKFGLPAADCYDLIAKTPSITPNTHDFISSANGDINITSMPPSIISTLSVFSL
jgi:hypothetical protein